MVLFIQIFLIALGASIAFNLFLRSRGEENNFIWDLFLGTNIVSFIVTIIIGSILQIYFPVYFLSLLGVYYFVYIKFLQNKKLIEILTYFSINIYVVFIGILIADFALNPVDILFSISTLILLFSFLIRKNFILGLYAIPFLYYASLIIHNPVFLQDIIAFSLKRFFPDIYFYDDLFIFTFFILLVFMELRYNKILRIRQSDEEKKLVPDYEYIMKFRTKNL